MLGGSVRGNWRDLLLMARAPLPGTSNHEVSAAHDRVMDREIVSAMIDVPEGSSLWDRVPLDSGIGR